MMTGSLCVPNVGLGDIEVRFNHHDSAERDKALRMLTDMQKRGYAILVRLDDGSYTRAVEIDTARGCYVVQLPDFDAQVAGSAPVAMADALADALAGGWTCVPPPTKGKRGRRRAAIPISGAHAVGIARSAGG